MRFIITEVSPEIVWPVRHTVMYPNMDFESIKLEEDAEGIHLALYGTQTDSEENKTGRILISVVSLFSTPGELQFRKFATLNEYQGRGYGSALLNYIIKYGRDKNINRIWCNARKNATEFYKRAGFKETNQEFFKDGYDFVIMELHLK
jgi:GNAT superfamily N-acetyltransferase